MERDARLSYEQKRDALSQRLKGRSRSSNGKVSLSKSTSNLFRPRSDRHQDVKLDVSEFCNVISVDTQNMTADVEGMTTYETLVDETLKFSCLPTVVPELKSITIGGALSGCGIESSSFRYGLVHETIEQADVLLSDGSVVTCSANNTHSDLYYAFPNTFGTLGYALKVRVKLIPAKKYVKLTHHRYSDPAVFFKDLEQRCEQGRQKDVPEYIEGVIFSPNEMYITTGEFVDEAPFTSNYHFRNIYYRSIRHKTIDYLTARDYIWRWDTDWFWCSDVFLLQNPAMRFLFGKFTLGSKRFSAWMRFYHRHPILGELHRMFYGKQESVIQDISIPIEKAHEFYKFFDDMIGIYPIWICPTKAYRKEERFDFCPMEGNKLYLDFGFWKSIPSNKEEGFFNRALEQFTMKAGGFKSLYSTSYYTENEFWSIYDASKYRKIKMKYDSSNHLRDLYHKCVKRG